MGSQKKQTPATSGQTPEKSQGQAGQKQSDSTRDDRQGRYQPTVPRANSVNPGATRENVPIESKTQGGR